MDIEVRPCASVEELRDALNAISHYFGAENQTRGRRALRAVDRRRAHARRVRRRPDRRRRGRVLVSHVGARRRRGAGGGRHGRRRAADASPAWCPHVADARAARGLPRARRARRVPLGVGGDDLRSLRLRARVADRLRCRWRGPHAVRAAVRAARHGAARRPRGGGAHVPAAVRRGAGAAARHVLAQQGVVGDAAAVRRSRAAAGRPAEPRAARARRRAGRLRALPRQAGLACPASARAS